MKKKSKLILYYAIWFAAAIVCILLFYYNAVKFNFTYINSIREYEDFNIVIDDDNNNINILQTDKEWNVISKIQYPKISSNNYNLPYNVIRDEKDIYLCNFHNEIGVTEDKYTLYKLDFKNKEMIITKSYDVDKFSSFFEEYKREIISVESYISDEKIYFNVFTELSILDNRKERHLLCYAENEFKIVESENLKSNLMEYINLKNGHIALDYNYHLANNIYCGDNIQNLDQYKKIITGNDGNIYSMNLTKGVIDNINPVTLESKNISGNFNNLISKKDIEFKSLTNFSVTNENQFTTTFFNNGISGIVEYENGKINFYTSLTLIPLFKAIPLYILIAVLFFVAAWVMKKYLIYLSRKGSIISKMVTLLISAMIICDIVAAVVIRNIWDEMNENSFFASMTEAVGFLESINISEKIEDYHSFLNSENKNKEIKNLRVILNNILMNYYQNNEIKIADRNDKIYKPKENIIYEVYYLGLDKTNKKIIGIFSEYESIYIDNVYEPSFTKKIYDCAENNVVSSYNRYDTYGQLLSCVIYPDLNLEKETIGVFLISASKPEADNNLNILMRKIILFEIILCGLIILIFTIITFISLKPLKNLRKQAEKLTNGNTDCKVKTSGRYADEITELSIKFNEMADQVISNMNEIIRLREFCNAYFSDNILKLISIKSIALLNFNENVTKPLYVIHLVLPNEFNNFNALNKLVSGLTEQIEEYEGFIGNISGREITIFSKRKEILNIGSSLAQHKKNIKIIFDYTNINVQVIGKNPVYRFSITYENKIRYLTLCSYSENIKSSLLITESALKNIDKKTLSRCVGIIEKEYIYELISDASQNKRKLTKSYMQKGVNLYFDGEYVLARNMFIKLLSYDKDDYAAKFYVNLIDGNK